jgi:hypothetical protein
LRSFVLIADSAVPAAFYDGEPASAVGTAMAGLAVEAIAVVKSATAAAAVRTLRMVWVPPG